MKKFLCFLIVCVILLSTLAGCGGANIGLSGTDMAKRLLAEERLNSALLKNKGDIFENGIKVMRNLADIATANLNVPHVGRDAVMTNLSTAVNLSTVLTGDYIGKLEIDGDTFIWSDFEENNNSYDYFKDLTENIIFSAEVAADLIDNIKKQVRVIDKWVAMESTHYYLSVEENSEILCELDTRDEFLSICKRYKNADGKDVYELFRKQDGYQSRMTYSPGERYELSSTFGANGEDGTYFTADNSKGYWETYVLGKAPQHYNVSYFIMKDDICYDAFYDPKNGDIPLLKVMSADRATDIFHFSDYGDTSSVSLQFAGFDGIKNIVADAENVEYVKGEYANLTSSEHGVVNFENGKNVRVGDTFGDNVMVNAIHAIYGAVGYTGEVILNIHGETRNERLQSLKSFLNEYGMRCRRDIDEVFRGIDRAYVDVDGIIKYYKWNGIIVTDEDRIADAIEIELARFADMESIYTDIKDAEVIDYSDTRRIAMNIKFAPITEKANENVTLDGTGVSVGNISLTIKDTTLYVVDEPYKIAFALTEVNGENGLIHIDVENDATAIYTDGNKFTVSASDLSFELPTPAAGSYTLVAYISTADGIRSSGYVPVSFDRVSETTVTLDSTSVSAKNGTDGVTITYSDITDFTVSLVSDSKLDYEAFKLLIAAKAFEHGTPSETVEIKSGDGFTSLSGAETEIASGTYRIGYTVHNGSSATNGYIYAEYLCTAE